jgi:hypothetical protein
MLLTLVTMAVVSPADGRKEQGFFVFAGGLLAAVVFLRWSYLAILLLLAWTAFWSQERKPRAVCGALAIITIITGPHRVLSPSIDAAKVPALFVLFVFGTVVTVVTLVHAGMTLRHAAAGLWEATAPLTMGHALWLLEDRVLSTTPLQELALPTKVSWWILPKWRCARACRTPLLM